MIDVTSKVRLSNVLLIVVMAIVSHTAFAGSTEMEVVKSSLKTIIKVEPDSVKLTPVDGLYEIAYGSKIVYMTKDGNFLIEGDVFDVKKGVNITESVRSVGRQKAINGIDPEHVISFAPKGNKAKHVITAFTDIDCGYCRKLHQEIKKYNDLGIEMRYVAFPRSGPQTKSYFKAVAVWCAKDRNKAMTFAKGGAKLDQLKALAQVDNAKACEDAVMKHLDAAKEIGITGTPTLFMENGQIIPGYVPAERLIKMLEG